jgi:hypothetical protein
MQMTWNSRNIVYFGILITEKNYVRNLACVMPLCVLPGMFVKQTSSLQMQVSSVSPSVCPCCHTTVRPSVRPFSVTFCQHEKAWKKLYLGPLYDVKDDLPESVLPFVAHCLIFMKFGVVFVYKMCVASRSSAQINTVIALICVRA